MDLRTSKQKHSEDYELQVGRHTVMKMVKNDGVRWVEIDAAWLLEQKVKDLLDIDCEAIVFIVNYKDNKHYITNDEKVYVSLKSKHPDSIIIWMHEFFETLKLMRSPDNSIYFDTVEAVLKVKGVFPDASIDKCSLVN